MTDLLTRALGRAALRKVAPERERQKRYNDMRLDDLQTAGMVSAKMPEPQTLYGPEIEEVLMLPPSQSHMKQIAEGIEENCFEDMAALIGYYYPELVVSGPAFREQLARLARSDNQIDRLRRKYGWHKCSELLPNHSRHVVIWTNRGEYRAYYDHVHGCWRTTRDGLRITHWREQCGPEDWPRAE